MSNKGEQIVFQGRFGDQINPLDSNRNISTSTITINHIYNYLDIPFRAIYTIRNRKIKFTSSVGITLNYFIEAKQSIKFSNESFSKSKSDIPGPFNKINISPTNKLRN